MQSRPAFNRFRRPAGDGGGMHQPLPNLCRHPSHRLHLCSLGGRVDPGHLHPLQGTLCQLHRPLSTLVRASRHFGLLGGSSWGKLLWRNQVFVAVVGSRSSLQTFQTGRVYTARSCLRDHRISKENFSHFFLTKDNPSKLGFKIIAPQTGNWMDCANFCKGNPSYCKAWSYREEPIRLTFCSSDLAKRKEIFFVNDTK